MTQQIVMFDGAYTRATTMLRLLDSFTILTRDVRVEENIFHSITIIKGLKSIETREKTDSERNEPRERE